MAAEGERDAAAAAAAGGKRSLKRLRRPRQQEAWPLPGRSRTAFAGSCSWFEHQSLTDAECSWKMLLEAVDPHLNCSSFEKVIHFPEFLGECSQISNPQPEPETLNVGMKSFQWVPFPPYCREHQVNDAKVSPKAKNLILNFTEIKKEDKRFRTISLGPEQKPFPVNTAEESRPKETAKHATKLDGRQISRENCAHQQNGSGLSALGPVHSQPRTFDSQELVQETATQSEGEKASHNDPPVQCSIPFQHVPAVFHAEESLPAGSRVSGFQEKSEDQTVETLTLDCCPMCQMHFTGTMSQLDLDSHLAKCLAESADDVLW